MNLLLYGSKGPLLSQLARALKPLGLSSVRVAGSWTAFQRGVGNDRPDFAILLFEAFLSDDPQLAVDAHEYLIEQRLPAVVAIREGNSTERRMAEFVAGFDVLIEAPYDAAQLEAAIEMARNQVAQIEDPAPNTQKLDVPKAFSRESDATVLEPEPPSARPIPRVAEESTEKSLTGNAPRVPGAPLAAESTGSQRVPTQEVHTAPDPYDDGDDDFDIDAPLDEEAILSEVLDDSAIRNWSSESTEVSRPKATDRSNDAFEVRDWSQNHVSRPASEVGGRVPPARRDGQTGEGEDKTVLMDSPPTPRAPSVHKPVLPDLLQGEFGEVSAIRIFFLHHALGSTGRLVLKMDRIKREILFKSGMPGLEGVSVIDDRTRSMVESALLWERGSYAFYREEVRDSAYLPFENPLAVAFSAISDGMTLNQVVIPLTDKLKHYPCVTDQSDKRQRYLSQIPGIIEFLGGCGDRPLEKLASRLSGGMENTLKSALFCMMTDLIVFEKVPVSGRTRVEYDRPPEAQARNPERTPPPRSREPSAPSQSNQRTVVVEQASSSDEDEALMMELAKRAESFRRMSPHQIFGIEEGCGRNTVQQAYYRLVKEHHPDTYALARSPEIKPLAEEVFHLVRVAYNDLVRIEKSNPESRLNEGNKEANLKGRTGFNQPMPTASRMSAPADSGVPRSNSPSTPHPDPVRRQPEASSPRTTHDGSRYRTQASGPVERTRITTSGGNSATRIKIPRRKPTATAARPGPNSTFPGRSMTAKVTGISPGVQTTTTPKQAFKAGVTQLAAGNNDSALGYFQQAYSAEENNASYVAHYAWTMYLNDSEKVKDAVTLLKKALVDFKDADLEWPALFLGHIFMAEDREDKALRFYQQALEANPRNIEAKRRLRLHDMRKKANNSFLDKLFTKRKKPKK
ncbi:MAG: DnaJ domain-containing protein [Myxococcales bacterium]|nr:DnaJ domain-containing protein [Myxococcales bacterium]